jgi:hypothetical protein
VDDGLVQEDFVESEFGTEKRDYFKTGDHAIGVSERDIGGRFAAMNGDVANLRLQSKRNSVDATDLGAAIGNSLDLGNQAAADQRLKGFSIDVKDQSYRTDGESTGKNQQKFPPASGRLGG